MTSKGGFPRRFDAYVLLKPLARGGMGQLFLALAGTPGLEKPCVIKQVPPDLVAPENARRFRDEAMVALRLAHGNLVSVFDAGIHEGQIFLAMEYVDGRDLHAVWNRCAERKVPFPVDVAVYIVKELARGLAYAHAFEELKLVHRDVSPSNLLLSFSGEVKLTDFGLATSALKLEQTAPGIVYGKMSYLSPEQARREPLDGRADLYAAGILLWELLTGRPLFPTRSAPAEGGVPGEDAHPDPMHRARNPEVVAPSTITRRVPPALDRIVMRALAPERANRYPDGESLRADLASFLAETAPKTDAARLADFLRPLYADDVRADRTERAGLVSEASRLMSGALASASSMHTALSPTPPRSPGPAGNARVGTDPRIDATIGGRYYVRRLCGEGAMGRVYEAHHIDIGRRVAIKVLHASFLGSPDLVERFRREARAASRIGHANIVDVTDSGTTADGAFYFVMEYLDGMNLEQLIDATGALSVERSLLITAQITRALEAAHAADIIHRDLKPANVMLINRKDEEDFVKVLDFGISKDLDDAAGAHAALTRPNVAIGTPTYMAPEQAAGRPANPLTDVYAVGGLLFEMLTGAAPCSGGDAMAVLAQKANEDPPPIRSLRPELPRALERLVARAVARVPADRHPSMTALKEDVLAILAGGEGAAAPKLIPPTIRIAAVPTPVFSQRTRRLGRGVVTAGIGGVVTLLVVFLALRDRAGSPAAAPLSASRPTVASAPLVAPALPEASPTILPPGSVPETAIEPAAAAPTASAAHRGGFSARDSTRPTWVGSSRPLAVASVPRKLGPASPPRSPSPSVKVPDAIPPDAILKRGQAAFDRGDYPESVRRGREAIAAGAALGGHLLIGDTYYRLERYADAMQEYQAALALDPEDPGARRQMDLARQAAAHAR